MEPAASTEVIGGDQGNNIALTSIAISMKRIALAAERIAESVTGAGSTAAFRVKQA